jgi:hypothetical protein
MYLDQTVKAVLLVAALIPCLPATARAQEFGVHGGVTAGPTFGFVGVRFGLPNGRGFMWFDADLAGGTQAATIFTWGLESPKLHRSTLSWAPYFGGGLTLFLAHKRSLSDSGERLGGGWCVLFGVENRRRVSMEIQVNFFSHDLPRVHFAVGYRFH